MGNQANIGHGKYPRQGAWLGRRARVCFNYDMRNVLGGVIVRDDTEDPYRTIIHLDDGRFLLASECQFNLPEGAAVPAAPFVEIDPADIRGVYEHACDSPTCPACKPEPAPEPTLITDHTFLSHYYNLDMCGHFIAAFGSGYCRARREAHKAPSAAKEGR